MLQGTGRTEKRQAIALFAPPDILTALRLPLAVAFAVMGSPWARFAIVVVAAISDVADGIWARRIGGSRLGSVLDPVCDKAFIGTAFIVVWISDALTPLELLGVLLRDILAMTGFLVTSILRRPTALPARAGGKAVTVAQVLTLLAWTVGSDLLRPLAWATAAISVYAVADYGKVAWSR